VFKEAIWIPHIKQGFHIFYYLHKNNLENLVWVEISYNAPPWRIRRRYRRARTRGRNTQRRYTRPGYQEHSECGSKIINVHSSLSEYNYIDITDAWLNITIILHHWLRNGITMQEWKIYQLKGWRTAEETERRIQDLSGRRRPIWKTDLEGRRWSCKLSIHIQA